MVTPELVSFVKGEIAKGKTKEQIKSELLAGGGWQAGDIDEAFQSINPQVPLPPNISVPVPHKKRKLAKLYLILGILLIIVAGSFFIVKNFSNTSSVLSPLLKKTVGSKNFISNTRPLSNVSENPKELLKIMGLSDKRFSGADEIEHAIVKTKDGRFWFLTLVDSSCSDFCSGTSYVVDFEKKNFSLFNVREVIFDVTPISGSFVTIEDLGAPTSDGQKYKKFIYDVSEDRVVDELEVEPFENGNYTFISDNFFLYSKYDILYLRDIEKHEDIKLGRSYDRLIDSYEKPLPVIFSPSGEVFYALIYVNETPANAPGSLPEKEDPVALIEWNIKGHTRKDMTKQTFDFPLEFELLDNNHILLGGGMDSVGLKTYSTYIVFVDTGEVKEIFNGDTVTVESDKSAKQIKLFEPMVNDFIIGVFGGPHDSGTMITFDYSGNQLSKIYYKDSLTYKIIKSGTGKVSTRDDIVKVNYSIPSFKKEMEIKLLSEKFKGVVEYSARGMKIGEKRHVFAPNDLIATLGFSGIPQEYTSNEFDLELISLNGSLTANSTTTAQCIKAKGAVFYGTFWCPHCESQKRQFKQTADDLPYIECSTPDGKGLTEICKAKNITSFPFWTFADGTSNSGEMEFSQLAYKTNCPVNLGD